jgi:hypothetical protein
MDRMTKKKESKRQLVLHKLEAKAQSTTHEPEREAFRAKIEELKIHRVIVQVAPATDGGDPGEVAAGYYIIEDGTLVMTDAEGAPLKHHAIDGQVRLLPDQNADQVARILVRNMRGKDPRGGFYRRLQYDSRGIV